MRPGRLFRHRKLESLEPRQLLAIVASAGGPYQSVEGTGLELDASDTTSDDGSHLAFSWDLNADGNFGDAVGARVSLTWGDLRSISPPLVDGTHQVALRVSNGVETVTDTTQLTIRNLAPIVTSVEFESVSPEATSVEFAASAVDPGNDRLIYVWDFGDGTDAQRGDALHRPVHVYDRPGRYTVTTTVLDADGGSATHLGEIAIVPTSPIVVYDAASGEIRIESEIALNEVTLVSDSGVFTGEATSPIGALVLVDRDERISFSSPLGVESLSLGRVAATGLSEEFFLTDFSLHMRSGSHTVASARVVRLDGEESTLSYDSVTGELVARHAVPVSTLQLISSSGVFEGMTPNVFESNFDVYRPDKLFHLTPFGAEDIVEFGPSVRPGLTAQQLHDDLQVQGSVVPNGRLNSYSIVATTQIATLVEPPNDNAGVIIDDLHAACAASDLAALDEALIAGFQTINVGDVNLDRVVSSADLVQVLAGGRYENFDGATWSEGDINCDGFFDSSDLVFILQKGYYESGQLTYEPPTPPDSPDSAKLALRRIRFVVKPIGRARRS